MLYPSRIFLSAFLLMLPVIFGLRNGGAYFAAEMGLIDGFAVHGFDYGGAALLASLFVGRRLGADEGRDGWALWKMAALFTGIWLLVAGPVAFGLAALLPLSPDGVALLTGGEGSLTLPIEGLFTLCMIRIILGVMVPRPASRSGS